MLLHNQGCRLFQIPHFTKVVQDAQKKILYRFQVREVGSQASIRTAQSCIRTPIQTIQGCIRPYVTATHSDTHQSSTRNPIFFSHTNMGRQLHPSGRQGNTVRTLSLIRQDVEKNCNRPNNRATPFERDPYYGIYVQ
jgi:hypothetical protein